MKYAVLIYGSAETWQGETDDERNAKYAEYGAVSQTPGITAGAELEATTTATTVRVRGGETLTTDGPFAETKEVLGGLYMLDADDLDAAIAFAARIPDARTGSIEVRPVVEHG